MQKLENGLYQYPQNEIAHGIIDGMCYWFGKNEMKNMDVSDSSSGEKYINTQYISTEEILSFFST
jgi:hypothetical protein